LAIQQVIKKIRTATLEIESVRSDDSQFLEIHLAPIAAQEQVSSLIGIVSDITTRKRIELDLLQAYRDLELYTALLHHDLGNDLQLVLSSYELVQSGVSKDSEVWGTLQPIGVAANRMADLLALLRIPLEEEKAIVPLLETLGRKAEQLYKGLTVSVEADPKMGPLQTSSGRLLPLVFENLFRNAAQHAGSNPAVRVVITRVADEIQIDIIDDGPGVPAEIQAKLFQRGVSSSGSGIGLYLCKQILDAYGGSIELLKPRKGQGAAFRILLPLVLVS
jgi:signal transduction histidine kinase